MSDFFKSALGYFNPGQNGGSVGGGCADDGFVGQIVEVGTVKLLVKRLIAEGTSGGAARRTQPNAFPLHFVGGYSV